VLSLSAEEFSLRPSDEQLEVVRWVHEFAEDVIRPAAHEWDEREETPWPILEEAAKVGLYGLDFIATAFLDKTGLLLALSSEELAWGDAGIALALMGTALAVSAIYANGTPQQQGEWLPQCYGTPGDLKLAASRSPRRTRARTCPRSRRPPGTTRPRTSGF